MMPAIISIIVFVAMPIAWIAWFRVNSKSVSDRQAMLLIAGRHPDEVA